MTPNKRSRQESATVPSDAAEAGPSSKPASPHSRRQSNVVVEIPHSRPGSALAQRDSPSRVAERAAITISRPSSPIAPSEEEGIFPGANSPRTADDTISSTAPSPELEEVPSAKSRSRKIPPQPDLPRSSPSVQRRRSPISSSSKSLNAEAELLMSPRSASLETDSSTALPNHTSNKDRTAVNKSSPAKAFNSPNDPWFAKPSRKAAATRKTYAEDTSNSSDEDEEPYVANSASNLAQRGSKAASHGSRKGKERAIEDQNASPSRTAEQPQAMGTNGHTPAKAEKKFKQRGSTSVPKKKAALPKSKSDTHLTGKGKTKGRRKGSTSSGSSDIEDFFNVHSPSPSKPKKKTTTRKKPTPAKKAALSQAAKAPHLSAKPISGGSSDDDLPTLPFSSQPPSQSQATSTFDLLDIDDIAFVSVPARRKAEVHTLTPPNDHIVHFWWPARIINRNRKNFTVSLIFGDPDQDRNFFP